jgi:hypothetical protein
MFVLMSLMYIFLQRARVLLIGVHQSPALIQYVQRTSEIVAYYLPNLTAPLHAPIPKLTV